MIPIIPILVGVSVGVTLLLLDKDKTNEKSNSTDPSGGSIDNHGREQVPGNQPDHRKGVNNETNSRSQNSVDDRRGDPSNDLPQEPNSSSQSGTTETVTQ